ncbi:hypothetical protein LXL04_002329 [Taraxacum kok-saghyz]
MMDPGTGPTTATPSTDVPPSVGTLHSTDTPAAALQRWVSVVSYALGIYILNLLIGFISPQVDPEFQDLSDGPTLPSWNSDEFRPCVRRLLEFKFWITNELRKQQPNNTRKWIAIGTCLQHNLRLAMGNFLFA